MLSDRLLSRLSYSQLEWLRRNAVTSRMLDALRDDHKAVSALARRETRLLKLQQNHPERFED